MWGASHQFFALNSITSSKGLLLSVLVLSFIAGFLPIPSVAFPFFKESKNKVCSGRVMTGSSEDRPEAIESPCVGIPVVENPLTTNRSESAQLLKKGSGKSRSKSSGRYSIADEDEVSDSLLQMAEQGGLRSHATNVVYRYNGKKCSLLKVSGNDYAKVVQELAKHRRHAKWQLGMRICQIISFVIAALAIAFGVWAVNYQITLMQKELTPYAKQAQSLQPSIGELSQTVSDLNTVVGGLTDGVNVAENIVEGVQNVVGAIGSNQSAEAVSDILKNATSIVGDSIQGLGETGDDISKTVGSIAAGNTTISDGIQSIGQSFADFGQSFVQNTQQAASNIVETSTNVFCTALPFICDEKEEDKKDEKKKKSKKNKDDDDKK